MRKLASLVGEAIGREEILRAARAKRLMRRWEEVVGTALAQKSAPDKYDHGTLWVAVSGSAWAQNMRMVKDDILRKLAEISGEATLITDVRFGVRPLKASTESTVEPTTDAASYRDSIKDLTHEEIVSRRVKKWRDEGGA